MKAPGRKGSARARSGGRSPRAAGPLCEALEPRWLLSGGTISGEVWHDADGDGLRGAGETGLPYQTVYVDLDGDGQYDHQQHTVALEPQFYNGVPINLVLDGCSGVVGDVDATVRLRSSTTGLFEYFLISPSGTRVQLYQNDGFTAAGWLPAPGRYDDETAHSVPGSSWLHPAQPLSAFDGEPPNGTWKLEVLHTTGSPASWSSWEVALSVTTGEPATQTDAEGRYALPHVPPGPQVVRAAPPTGWVLTAPADGAAVEVVEGAGTAGVDLGVYDPPGSLRGRVWDDRNGDGRQDAGEPPLANWGVYLDLNRNDRFDAGEPLRITDAAGQYAFTDLPAGEYRAMVFMQAGWKQTSPIERLFAIDQVVGYPGECRLAQVLPTVEWLPLPYSSPNPPRSTSGETALPAGLAVGADSLFCISGDVLQYTGEPPAEQVVYELDLQTGKVLDADAVSLPEKATGMAYLGGLVYIMQEEANRIEVFDPRTDTVVRSLQLSRNVDGGLTAAADRGVLLASTPPSNSLQHKALAIDPTTGAVLWEMPAYPEKMIYQGWYVWSLQNLGYYDGQFIHSGVAWGFFAMDPRTGFTVNLQPPPEGVAWQHAAIGGDGAPRGVRVTVAGNAEASASFGVQAIGPAPMAIDLLPGSDTGASDSDNLTWRNNRTADDTLEFRVDGTLPGATVELYARGYLVGSAVATGISTVVTTNGGRAILGYDDASDADGPVRIWARQHTPGLAMSPWSTPLTISIESWPTVQQIIVNDGSAHRSVVTSVAAQFDEAVLVTMDSFELWNLTTGQQVAPGSMALTLSTRKATLKFPSLPGQSLPEGRYVLRLKAANITDKVGHRFDGNGDRIPGDDYEFRFHCLPGDVDGDGTTALSDLAILATYWNQWNRTPQQGDLNLDTRVNPDDLAILASNWNRALPLPTTVAPEPVASRMTAETPRSAPTATTAARAGAPYAAQAPRADPELRVGSALVDLLAPARPCRPIARGSSRPWTSR